MAHMLATQKNGTAAMAYTGETPWHGLGQRLQGDPTIPEMIAAAGLDWDVDLVPLRTDNSWLKSEGIDKDAVAQGVPARAIRRRDTGAILGVVGLQYHSLANSQAFRFFEPFLEAKLASLHTAGALQDGRKVWVLAKIKRDPIEITAEDVVEKYVLLSNSHDGTTSIRAGFTPIRVVCWNTLSLAHSDKAGSKLIRVRHTKHLEKNLDAIREVIDIADQEFKATAEQFKRLRHKHINQADVRKYVREVFQIETDDSKLNGQQQRLFASIARLVEEGMGAGLPGAKGTMWGLYNACTAYCSWERGNSQDTRLASLWFGESNRTLQRALEVAVQMAV